MNKQKQKGFTVVEGLLLLVIAGLVGFTGWYVWNSKNKTDNLYDNSTSSNIPKYTSIKTFEDCKKSVGSKIQESFPEVCVTATGKRFTNTTAIQKKYLDIKEWTASILLSDATDGYFYKLSDYQTDGKSSDITVYSKKADAIVGPKGVSCKGEYIAYILRLPTNDPNWDNPSIVSPLLTKVKEIAGYTFAITTKKQYGPECFDKGNGKDGYVPDSDTGAKFGAIVERFVKDYSSINTQ